MKKEGKLIFVCICVLLFSYVTYTQSTANLMRSGIQLLRNGGYDQAISRFRKVLSWDPGNFEAQYYLGYAYLVWGKNSTAVKELIKAVNINLEGTEAWLSLANAYENLGQSNNALNALYHAAETDSQDPQARINIAIIYVRKGRISEAVNMYIQVIQIDGSNIDTYVNLASCLITLNRVKEAIYYLKEAIAVGTDNGTPYYELGNILWKREKDIKEAIKNYQKAITIQPNSQEFYENFGLLLEDEWEKNKDDKKRLEAIEVWEKSLVYLDDVYKKEMIKDRLTMLKRGKIPSGKVNIEELFGKNNVEKRKFEELQKEMTQTRNSKSGTTYKKIIVGNDNTINDLLDIENDSTSSFSFDIDEIMKEKKKRIKKKE